jgi:PAS domain S-box-containing protein
MYASEDSAKTRDELLAELAELRARLAEPEETVEAIRRGEIDAFVVLEPGGEQVYTLATADLLHQLHIVTDSLPALIAYVDRDLRYRFNSRRYEAWFGIPPHRITGRRVVEVLGEPAFAIFRAAMEEALAGQQVACERWAPMPNLGERCLRASFVPHVLGGDVLGFVAFVEDITERKRAEDALRLLADAGELLSESLGVQETLEIGARLAVPRLADWCVIDLVGARRERAENGGSSEGVGGGSRLVSTAPDGARQHLLRELQSTPPVWRQGTVAAEVLRTGEPALLADAPAAIAGALAGEDGAAIVAALAPCSLASVPLTARGHTLGVWHLVYAESGRRHQQEELTVALELARRTAVAIDNARLYRELEAASQAKDHFLATLSHELRTPLTPVLAIASKLETDDPLPPNVRSAFGMIRRNVELEARLIDDLLDLTRVTRGKLELYSEATDLRQVIRQAIETCGEPELAARHLEIDLAAGDHRVWGDPSRLAQVFWNLLSNAVKFTPEGGSIRLRSYLETAPTSPATPPVAHHAGGAPIDQSRHSPQAAAAIAGTPGRSAGASTIAGTPCKSAGASIIAGTPGRSAGASTIAGTPCRSLVVEIADSGIGVEASALPHIFDAFDQGRSGITRRFGGLGLGLAISRAIVERHDGSLTAASAGRDRGTTLTVRLPLLGSAGLDETAAASVAAADRRAAGSPETGASAPRPPFGGDASRDPHEPGTEPAAMSGGAAAHPPPAMPGGGAAGLATLPSGPATPGAGLPPLHILLVEDHADTGEAMVDLFAALDVRVTVAATVAAALAAAERGGIDLVISDLGLPDGDGRDLMRRLAERYGLRGIALSGYGREDDVGKSRAAGFSCHLTKPVTIETLRSAIEQLGIAAEKRPRSAPVS